MLVSSAEVNLPIGLHGVTMINACEDASACALLCACIKESLVSGRQVCQTVLAAQHDTSTELKPVLLASASSCFSPHQAASKADAEHLLPTQRRASEESQI
jgi:hypothetical protein